MIDDNYTRNNSLKMIYIDISQERIVMLKELPGFEPRTSREGVRDVNRYTKKVFIPLVQPNI